MFNCGFYINKTLLVSEFVEQSRFPLTVECTPIGEFPSFPPIEKTPLRARHFCSPDNRHEEMPGSRRLACAVEEHASRAALTPVQKSSTGVLFVFNFCAACTGNLYHFVYTRLGGSTQRVARAY